MKNKVKATEKELFYDKFSSRWASKINNAETQKRLKIVFQKLLKSYNLKGKKFLEVGCGLGYFSEMANKLDADVTGVDVGESLVKITKKRVPRGKFVKASASQLPFNSGTFDVVLCTEVIEHVENQNEALKELSRVLKRNGILVITTPNRLFKFLFDFLGILGVRPYKGNEKWYYPWTLKKMLGSQGRIKNEVYFNFFFPSKYLDVFERFKFLRYLMINQGYLVKKI